ncbi:hypothetical protein [Candidatus Pantoea persica]|uniref:hypothetical protein n=1 Tax=Candidatus Pantoea persica TaxID=2518128 RepID=UPI00215DA97E|nr:hypothetical protein [Candidatus Pantoea persica]MBA2817474.1 Glycogen synthase [Candidatus Pantoea persica]
MQIGYHEAFSHHIVGGADVIIVPSRFKPCGLIQLYGLKYGTLVRRTGGLADTVNDSSLENLADGIASGFSFEDATPGRCCARSDARLFYGHGLRSGATYSGRRWGWISVDKWLRRPTVIFINVCCNERLG